MSEHRQKSPQRPRNRWILVLLLLAAALGVWFVWGAPRRERTPSHPVLGDGRWLGGFGNLEAEEPLWMPALFELEAAGNKVHGQFTGRLKAKVTGELTGDGVRLAARLGQRDLACHGRREGAFLVGDCTLGARSMALRLTTASPADPQQTEALLGLYEIAPGHRIAINRDDVLLAIDLETGWSRALFLEQGDRYFTGPKLAVPFPVEQRVTFTRDAAGEVSGLELSSETETVHAARCCPVRSEPFSFQSAGVTLRGTLYLPPGDGHHPALVWVHGSGRSERRQAMHFPLFLASEGYAVLAYDKRGVGASGGSYAMPGGSTFGIPFLERRAQDVLAAVRALRERPEIDPRRVGLFGISQAGWVAAKAARSPEVAFTVIYSGGATQLSLEDQHSRWSGETFATGGTVDEVIARLRRERPTDPGFRADFEHQSGPGLWLYGFKDRSNPSQLCAELIEDVATTNGKDFTVVRFPNGNHALLEARRGGYDEYGALERFVPNLHRIIIEWLNEKAGMPTATTAFGGGLLWDHGGLPVHRK